METKLSSGWRFWGSWGLAFVGFPIGGLAAKALVGSVGSSVEGLLAGAATGAVVGTASPPPAGGTRHPLRWVPGLEERGSAA